MRVCAFGKEEAQERVIRWLLFVCLVRGANAVIAGRRNNDKVSGVRRLPRVIAIAPDWETDWSSGEGRLTKKVINW